MGTVTVFTLGFSDPSLRTLHSRVLGSGTITNGQMDGSVQGIRYYPATGQANHRSWGTADRIIQSHELFEAITRRFSLQRIYQRQMGEDFPWVPNGSATTRRALRGFDQFRQEWSEDHPTQSLQSTQFARAIFIWITDRRGFGLTHDENAPERSFNQLVRHRRGDCTEFAFAMMVFYRRAGYAARPVWVEVDEDGHSAIHVCVEVTVQGQGVLVDPIYGSFGAAHRRVAPMSHRELLAWYWNNRALSVQQRYPAVARRYFARAHAIDPFNPYILVNRADFYRELGGAANRSRAQAEIQEALRVQPNFTHAQERLGNWAFDANRYSDAVVYYRAALVADPENLTARDNLVRSLLQLGQSGAAARQLGILRKKDPHYPHLAELATLVAPQRAT